MHVLARYNKIFNLKILISKIAFYFLLSPAFLLTNRALFAEPETEDTFRLLETGRYAEAASKYTNLCGKGCGNTDVKELVSSFETENVGDHCNRLGVAYMGLKNFKAAIRSFQLAVSCKDSSKFHSNLALAFSYDHNSKLAEIHYEKSMSLAGNDPGSFSAMLNYSIFLIKKKDFSKAEELLQEVIHHKVHLFYARLYLGYSFYQRKKFEEALSQFDQGIQENQKYPDLYLYRAYSKYQLNNLAGAEYDLNQAELLEPEFKNPKIDQLRSLIARRNQGRIR
ncbi:tetratricopeptide repeat protein [Leptospira interrogans]|uniref:tetratricopeptide repeat protein n=1 Tax=Leptospira interrogans TaxID=173 RepID=UPI0002B8BE3C|nr:tetratricopeptide repeat protein [Leptospira interrogans]EMF71522.1 tetratricopeptide repeat protein [Leptospira interrogans serovar Canicola str. LT1962]EMM92021.1 tetratricopeptide repeat protein [Leptospira interrogans serovar Djasiman str. LT1649]